MKEFDLKYSAILNMVKNGANIRDAINKNHIHQNILYKRMSIDQKHELKIAKLLYAKADRHHAPCIEKYSNFININHELD